MASGSVSTGWQVNGANYNPRTSYTLGALQQMQTVVSNAFIPGKIIPEVNSIVERNITANSLLREIDGLLNAIKLAKTF